MSFLVTDKPRVEPRVRALVRARLRDGGGEREICLIDVSSRGLLATAARPPRRGEFVEIQIGQHRLAGHVKWASQRRFGMALQERVSVNAVVGGGKRSIKLSHASVQAPRRSVSRAGLPAAPQATGRAAQFVLFLLLVGLGAVAIASLAGKEMAPLRKVVAAMKTH